MEPRGWIVVIEGLSEEIRSCQVEGGSVDILGSARMGRHGLLSQFTVEPGASDGPLAMDGAHGELKDFGDFFELQT